MRRFLLVLILFLMLPVTDVDAHNSVENVSPSVAYKPIKRNVVRKYRRGEYNLDNYIVGNKEIPKKLYWTEGRYSGYLYFSSWYISELDYVVTYSGVLTYQ